MSAITNIIPVGQSYREIDVTVSYDSCLGFQTGDEDSPLVSIKDGQTIRILAFSRYSLIVLKAAEGCSFGSGLTPAQEDVTYEVVEQSESSIQLAVRNTNHSIDASSRKLKLDATISGHDFCIQVNNPAYQQVDVAFNNSSFSYTGDIKTDTDLPQITFKRRGAAYFTLTGATFDAQPFFWENGKDDCIIDEGEDGAHAILTNLHHEHGDPTSHSFLLQVVDSQGHRHQSEDPTIVNIDPGDG